MQLYHITGTDEDRPVILGSEDPFWTDKFSAVCQTIIRTRSLLGRLTAANDLLEVLRGLYPQHPLQELELGDEFFLTGIRPETQLFLLHRIHTATRFDTMSILVAAHNPGQARHLAFGREQGDNQPDAEAWLMEHTVRCLALGATDAAPGVLLLSGATPTLLAQQLEEHRA